MAEYHRKTQTVKTKEEYTRDADLERAREQSLAEERANSASAESMLSLGSQRARDRIADEVARARPYYPPEVIASLRLTKFWAELYAKLLAWHSTETLLKDYALWNDQDREAAQRALFGVALAAHSTEIVELVRAAHAEIDTENPLMINVTHALGKLSQAINLIEQGSRR